MNTSQRGGGGGSPVYQNKQKNCIVVKIVTEFVCFLKDWMVFAKVIGIELVLKVFEVSGRRP